MKIRNGFVSNSSSASFVISLDGITGRQLKQIMSFNYHAIKLGMEITPWDKWTFTINNDVIKGYAPTGKFDMSDFLTRIGIDEDIVEYNDFPDLT